MTSAVAVTSEGAVMRRIIVYSVLVVVAVFGPGLVFLQLRHQAGVERTHEAFSSYLPPRMGDFGATRESDAPNR